MDHVDFAVSDRAVAQDVPLANLDPGQPMLFQRGEMWSVFERLRREAPIHYTPQSEFGPYWSISKYRNNPAGRGGPGDVLFRRRIRRHYAARPARRLYHADVHRHGSAAARRSAGSGEPGGFAHQPGAPRSSDTGKIGCDPGWSACGRAVRLGGARLDRADQPDARDAVRFSAGGAPPACPLVGCRDDHPRLRARRDRG